MVNGERVSELGSRVHPDAEIVISKDAERVQAKQVTILLNKPVGYVSRSARAGFYASRYFDYGENQLKQPGRRV